LAGASASSAHARGRRDARNLIRNVANFVALRRFDRQVLGMRFHGASHSTSPRIFTRLSCALQRGEWARRLQW
jgi:hypothetical protein